MHFLVDCIEKRFPDAMDFATELIHVEKAARGQWLCTASLTCILVTLHDTVLYVIVRKMVSCGYVVHFN